jgi:hypothetical protein
VTEDSPIGLDKWHTAVWQIVNCKNGISSSEVHRAIGVTQKADAKGGAVSGSHSEVS